MSNVLVTSFIVDKSAVGYHVYATTLQHFDDKLLSNIHVLDGNYEVLHRTKDHYDTSIILKWRHNEGDCVSNQQRFDCLLNRLFRRRSKETSKLRVTGLCEGNLPVAGEFHAQRGSNAENVSIWWRHRVTLVLAKMHVWRSMDLELIRGF